MTPSALSSYHPRRLDKAVASCLTTVADSDMACGNDRKEFIYHLPSKVSVSFVLHILPLFTKDTHGPVLFPSAGTLGNGRGGRRPASPRSSPCGYVQPSVLWQMLRIHCNSSRRCSCTLTCICHLSHHLCCSLSHIHCQ